MYVCICHAVTEQEVRDKAQGCCFTLAHYSKIVHDGGCGRCIPIIKEIINEEKHEHKAYRDCSTHTS